MSEWNVRYNATNNSVENWQSLTYDDSRWENATVKGLAQGSPWNLLVKRPFPKWKDSGLRDFVNSATIPSLSNGSTVEGILPYNARVSVYLKVKAQSGKIINIQTDQYDGWYAFGDGPAIRAEYITKDGVQEFETRIWMSGNFVKYDIPEGVEIVSPGIWKFKTK